MKKKLIIYDAPVFYTQGLSKLLTDGQIFDLVYICNSNQELYENLSYQPPEFLMLGNNCLGLSEMYILIQDLVNKHPNIKIIVIGNFLEMSEIRKLFDKGIKSYLDTNCGYAELVKSITALNSGLVYICDFAKERMMDFLSYTKNPHQNNLKETLTKRELEVLQLICDGLSSKNICEKLFISINTVESHRKKILLKFNVKNSAGVVKYAMDNHILR
ncbi:response regulator transcription factor [Chryseobacterium sp. FH1]|uniref:response regulator transcription factor n=1 Tax=Chryseobacterium sp. FH1 TaxID=1233951 RepID=UPI0004E46E65|nr:response regulator transcription factor [Chryseobacterium sp. FH1]KFC18270.1 LuxR family transcriptional regulator [Chryseobacterium sp. FH1]